MKPTPEDKAKARQVIGQMQFAGRKTEDIFAQALADARGEAQLDAARVIGGCACAAGIPILKLDDPEDWKRAVKQVKDYARGEERERCAVKCLDLATKWRDISQSRNVTRKERDRELYT